VSTPWKPFGHISNFLEVAEGVDDIRTVVNETKINLNQIHEETLHQKVCKWLKPPNPSTSHNKALKRRHPKTGMWFPEGPRFAKWKTDKNRVLWLHGIPGCGKTILTSAIIENVGNMVSSSQVMLYFYFDFNDADKLSLDNMIRSCIYQLYHQRGDTRKLLDPLFASCEDGLQQPSTESLCSTFLQMMIQMDDVFIVLDALDECRTRKGSRMEGLLSWLRTTVSESDNTHLLVTSRLEEDIQSAFSNWIRPQEIVPIQGHHITRDIRAYVQTRVVEDEGLQRWRSRPEVQREIETALITRVDGM
jgi:hypothetical protein